jgi:hypothetical protein
MFLVAVVAQGHGDDAALGISFDGDADQADAIGIKESGKRLGCQFVDFAVNIFLEELVALAEKRNGERAVIVKVVAGEAIELRRRELERRRMQGNDQALGVWQRFLLGIKVVREEPAGQIGLIKCAEPAVVSEALINPVTDVAAGSPERVR